MSENRSKNNNKTMQQTKKNIFNNENVDEKS